MSRGTTFDYHSGSRSVTDATLHEITTIITNKTGTYGGRFGPHLVYTVSP